MHTLKEPTNLILFAEIGLGLIILITSAACYRSLVKHIRKNEEELYRFTKTTFTILISFICAFMVSYSLVLFSVIFDQHYNFNSLFGPILFLGSVYVLATAYFNVGLFKKLLASNVELKKQTLHDYMTGLPNKLFLIRKIDQALAKKRKNPKNCFAIAFIDILNFKRVNDSFGHIIGDKVLIQTSKRIASAVRKVDTVGRLGGDDFIILIEDVTPREAIWFMKKIRGILINPYNIDGIEFKLDISYGICTDEYERQSENGRPADLINKANMAMRRSKKRGKNNFTMFVESMFNSAQDLLKFENDFKNGLVNNEFILVFQPQYRLHPELTVSGFEALVRWNHPKKGLISPLEFIPIAEKTGLILKLDRYVLDNACRIWSEWLHKNPLCSKQHISVNISASHVTDSSFIRLVQATILKYGLPDDSLVIEITESAIVDAPGLASQKLNLLQSLNVKCAIDDFGTGYSSLAYLTRFPTDILKIDRSFIDGIESSTSAKQIVKSVIDLAHGMNMIAIAEGVELYSQMKILEDLKCDIVQGFFLAKPLSEEEAFAVSKEVKSIRPTQ
ncbi:putative bifunctional diguanylate cyclase/phosphodiesterase [Maridesulfovibrio frigidus]|uniref:putative bifunctional diguanylate cyclase/phosphodiesterase n=1 Tax=Maridesulfovibrio frigidus TaxID=340956 RepID=UPI0004E0BDBF|nr:bifunctional diguanylate cyclase/phosphodiesterase [Maridesulfovibrio frigidus]